MKKRILSLLLIVSLFLAMFSTGTALAQDSSQANLSQPVISDWALDDLIVGDQYGIYPIK